MDISISTPDAPGASQPHSRINPKLFRVSDPRTVAYPSKGITVLPEESSSPIDRRTILRGAAWAAPVIAFAVAAPLASASGNAEPAAAPPAPRAPSALRLNFQTWAYSNRGRELKLALQAPYVDWQVTTKIHAITLTLALPKSVYPTGAFTSTQNGSGQGTWSVSSPVDAGSVYNVTLNWAGVLSQNPSQQTPELTFALTPGTPVGSGTIGITSVVGLDSANALIASASGTQSSTL